jgi:predicted acetyltransferase
MPAKEEYYTGFDFATVYYQKRGILSNTLGETNLICKSATEEDFTKLALFSEELLSEKYRVFAKRDESYYQLIKKQFEAEHGEIICVYDEDALVGYFFYGEYEAIEVMEPVCLDLYKNEFARVIANKFKESNKEIKVTAFDLLNDDDFKNIITKPVTMVRVVSLEMFASHLKAIEPIELIIEIEDEVIEENNGTFAFKIGRIDSRIEPSLIEPELKLSISELTMLCFYDEISKVLEEQMNENTMAKIKKIVKFTPIFLNELV